MTTKSMVKYKDFTIGSDSEIVLIDPKTNRPVRITDYVDRSAPFGADDHSKNISCEIRSGFSKNPLEVAKSIKIIMQQAIDDIPELFDFDWHAGAFIKSVPISFHCHFGHEKNLLDIDYAVTFLDEYALSLSILLEDRKQGLKRRAYNLTPANNEVSYGKLGQYREIEHPKLNRWEYRPISSTLSSQEICTAFLCLCKIVLFEHINNPGLRYKGYITPEDVITMNTKKIYSLFPHIWSEIQGMILYKKYAKHLQIIHDLIIAKECWTPKNIDIKAAWGLKLDENCISKPVFRTRKILKSKFDIVPNEGDFIKIPEFFPAPRISLAKYLHNSAAEYKDDIDNTDVLKPNIDIVKPVLKRAKKAKGLTVTKKYDYWPDDFSLDFGLEKLHTKNS